MDSGSIITAFVTLLVVIDPIGLAPLFIALTQGTDAAHRRAVGLRACLLGFVLLLGFGLLGEGLLGFVGISMPAFRIAGGILLFLTALDMLFERRTQRRQEQTATQQDPSVFPLATPLIAGPGALATMILLIGQAPDLAGQMLIYGAMATCILLVFLSFLAAPFLERLLGQTGNKVITRLLGMLLAALSVQFVLDGLAGFGLALNVI